MLGIYIYHSCPTSWLLFRDKTTVKIASMFVSFEEKLDGPVKKNYDVNYSNP
jgi:hypothetical protein